MEDWLSDKTTVTRLKIRSSGLDPLTAQQRVAGLLNAVSWQPAGLSASAILIIRQLRDPRPGALHLRQHDLCPPPAWEQALQREVDRLAREAAHPIAGAVPANAQAVVFVDRSEWLACLAVDWLDGLLTPHWWWRGLARQLAAPRAVVTTWLATAEYIPAALHHLATRSASVRFVRALTANEVRAMIEAVVRVFGLTELHRTLSDSVNELTLDGLEPQSVEKSSESPVATSMLANPLQSARAPWRSYVPEAGGPELSPTQQILLGVGLMLKRAPAEVRQVAFAREVGQWLAVQSTGQVAADSAHREIVLQSGSTPARLVVPAPDVQLHTNETFDVEQTTAVRPLDEPVVQDEEETVHLRPLIDQRELPDQSTSTVMDQAVDGKAIARPLPETDEPGEQIDTDFGGLFYFINLGLFLDLYADFSQPLTPGLDLPIWDFVALIGQRLIGDAVTADPVWALLARLAQRTADELPGQHFSAPAEWRMPLEWLQAFPRRDAWSWSVEDDRLRVHHPGGFAIIDVQRTIDDPSRQVHAELQAYAGVIGPLVNLPRSDQPVTTDRLDQWLSWLIPYIRSRLMLALGVSDPLDIPGFFEQRAQVSLTIARLDITMSIDDLPIAIRLAGLDRDPGWVPAAGRFIAFHFA